MIRRPLFSFPSSAWERTLSKLRFGYEAAGVLDQLMKRRRPSPLFRAIGPGRLFVRRSTDILVFDDLDLRTALGHIQQHACDPTNVAAVLRATGQVAYLSTVFRRTFAETPTAYRRRLLQENRLVSPLPTGHAR